MMPKHLLALCAVLAACAYATTDVGAQPQPPRRPAPASSTPAPAATPGTTSAFSGFQQNNREPISIESLSLEVRDKEKMATFIDNVKLVQGDTTLECRRLIVYYDEEPAAAGKGKPRSSLVSGAPEGGQQIRRLEAKGGVVVTQKDQIATGDNAVYEMKTNSIVLTGNVVMTQGQNVVKGDKLFVDMTTGVSRVESGTGGVRGPVRALFNPSSARPAPGAAPSAAPPAPANGRGATGSSDRGGARAATEREAPRGAAPPMKLN